jgi:hypothetical protein
MKNILLTLKLSALTLVSLPTFAFANLGDTHAQSAARYGKAFKEEGFTGLTGYTPKGKGWMIIEWFNENGLVEAIAYYQVSGNPISQKQMDMLCEINNVRASHWNKINGEAAGNVWLSGDSNWRSELSWDGTIGAKPLQRLILSTPHGFLGYQAALGAPDYQSQPSLPANANSDLPVSL